MDYTNKTKEAIDYLDRKICTFLEFPGDWKDEQIELLAFIKEFMQTHQRKYASDLNNLNELIREHRKEEMKAVMRFIATCNIQEVAKILAEVICVHDNLSVFNKHTDCCDKVENISIYDEFIELHTSEILTTGKDDDTR